MPARGSSQAGGLISEPKATRYVAKFMLRTGPLTQFKAMELAGDEGREGSGAVGE
jgi:hypothetical protein